METELAGKLSGLSVNEASNCQNPQGTFDWEMNEYAMTYPPKSKCYIFNHYIFGEIEEKEDRDDKTDENVNERKGSKKDAKSLKDLFIDLGFETNIWENFCVSEIIQKLEEVAREDHTGCSSFVCCVLTHGNSEFLRAKDEEYAVNKLFAPFEGNGCPTLLGKPKIFFIQACRGDILMQGVKARYKKSLDCRRDFDQACKGDKLDKGVEATYEESLDCKSEFDTLIEPDFLIAWATVYGFYSFRNPGNGSIFIQSLCKAIKRYANEKDLLSILTIVNNKVAQYQSHSKGNPSIHGMKQVSSFTSSLTKILRLS